MRAGLGRMVGCGLVLSATAAVAQPAPAPAPAPAPTGAFPDAAEEPPKSATEPAPPSAGTAAPAPAAPPPPDLPKPVPPAPSAPASAGATTNAGARPDRPGKAPPPLEPVRTYDWNLGAGIGFGDSGELSGLGFFAPISASTPSFRLALERRIAGGLWLTLNGSFLYTSAEGPPVNEGEAPPGDVKRTLLSVGGLVGVRQAMTSGIVETSVSIGFGLGYASVGGDEEAPQSFSGAAEPGSSALTYGFVGGLAVERELIEALALRLSANVVSLAWTNATEVPTTEGLPDEHTKSTTFAVDLVPVIDLRFYF